MDVAMNWRGPFKVGVLKMIALPFGACSRVIYAMAHISDASTSERAACVKEVTFSKVVCSSMLWTSLQTTPRFQSLSWSCCGQQQKCENGAHSLRPVLGAFLILTQVAAEVHSLPRV